MKHARKSPWRLLFKFHRYSGLAVALIAIFLALTGIALNHTEDLQLDSRYVQSNWLLDWYGIAGNDDISAFKVGEHWLSQADEQVFFDQQPVFNSDRPLLGAVAASDFIVVAHDQALTLLTLAGERIETVEVQYQVSALGLAGNNDIIIAGEQNHYRSADALLSWQISNDNAVNWAKPGRLPESLAEPIKNHARRATLPYERVMLDLHSGRLFGKAGVFIVDLAGILLILLSVSGSWMWLRHKVKSRRRIKHQH